MSRKPGWSFWPPKEPSAAQWERELVFAARVQTALLEGCAVSVPGATAVGCSVPHYLVGGDYFDFLALPDGKLRIFVADVMGKGFGAAMLMTMLRGAVRGSSRHIPSPEALLSEINDLIYRELQALGSFITASCADYDPVTGTVCVACAGHPAPLLLRQYTGALEVVKAKGMALGMLQNRKYAPALVTLLPGDLLVFFTDGIIEAKNASGRELSAEGLKRLITTHQSLSGSDLLQVVLTGVAEHTGGGGPRDDVTLLAFQFGGYADEVPL